nr:DUF1919 domain-containing protein [uncultured Eisenbergiella sp.]
MPTYEGLRLKILKYWRIGLSNHRRIQMKNTDFTIISNNCWGGMIYESYNLPKESPTVGMFFMADDYIRFLRNIKPYLASELVFIRPENSKWKDSSVIKNDKRFGSYPIARFEILLGRGTENIEIFFLHYHSEKEAKEKWERRIKRINWNRLLVKFNDQNGCTESHIKMFETLPYKNKICFTVKEYSGCKSVVRIKAPKSHEFIRASYEPYGKNRFVDVTRMLNKL